MVHQSTRTGKDLDMVIQVVMEDIENSRDDEGQKRNTENQSGREDTIVL